MDLSIIIVSYNCREVVVDCLRSIFEATKRINFEVIVVDNNSSDQCVETIKAEFPEVRVAALKTNLGFGAGCNHGATIASGDRLLFLNPDTIVLPGAVDDLFSFSKSHPDAGIWGGVQVDEDGNPASVSCWRLPTLWGMLCRAAGLSKAFRKSELLNWDEYGGWNYSSLKEVEVVSGCFLMISVTLWRELDGFNTLYFLYSEENDLCARALQKGARPLVCPRIKIIHHIGLTHSLQSDRIVYQLTGECTYMRIHWNWLKRHAGLALLLLLIYNRMQFYMLLSAVSKSGRHVDKGLHWRDVWKRRGTWVRGYTHSDLSGQV